MEGRRAERRGKREGRLEGCAVKDVQERGRM